MKCFSENFEHIFFTECNFGTFAVSDNTLRIPVSGLFVLAGHPLFPSKQGPYSGLLVFEGVSSSSRTVTEYLGGPMAPERFKESFFKEDGPFPEVPDVQNEYAFEGMQREPAAWIDNWIATARSFEFLADETE